MYIIYLNHVAFPVAPDKISTSVKNRNETVELIDGQEVNLLKLPGLTEFSFTVMIPSRKGAFGYETHYEGGYKPAHFYTDYIKKLKVNRKPVQLKIDRTFPDGKEYFISDLPVSLEDYTITESADEGFDLLIDLNFKQWVSYGAEFQTLEKDEKGTLTTSKSKVREVSRETARSYTVKAGDTLWAICKKELGDGNQYKEIARKNAIANPNRIYPGQVIRFG